MIVSNNPSRRTSNITVPSEKNFSPVRSKSSDLQEILAPNSSLSILAKHRRLFSTVDFNCNHRFQKISQILMRS